MPVVMKKIGHQEAEADGVQLGGKPLLGRAGVPVGHPQHDAGDERAEHGVDAETIRQRGEDEQEDERGADPQL